MFFSKACTKKTGCCAHMNVLLWVNKFSKVCCPLMGFEVNVSLQSGLHLKLTRNQVKYASLSFTERCMKGFAVKGTHGSSLSKSLNLSSDSCPRLFKSSKYWCNALSKTSDAEASTAWMESDVISSSVNTADFGFECFNSTDQIMSLIVLRLPCSSQFKWFSFPVMWVRKDRSNSHQLLPAFQMARSCSFWWKAWAAPQTRHTGWRTIHRKPSLSPAALLRSLTAVTRLVIVLSASWTSESADIISFPLFWSLNREFAITVIAPKTHFVCFVKKLATQNEASVATGG